MPYANNLLIKKIRLATSSIKQFVFTIGSTEHIRNLGLLCVLVGSGTSTLVQGAFKMMLAGE
jgi:hypothetical protein